MRMCVLNVLQERWEVPGAEYVQAPGFTTSMKGEKAGPAAAPAGVVNISATAAASAAAPAGAEPGAPNELAPPLPAWKR